jgi:hypothetical protein
MGVFGKCLNFHISFPIFSSRMFIVAVMQNFSIEAGQVSLSCTLFHHVCPEPKGAASPAVLGQTADCGGGKDDANRTVTDYGCLRFWDYHICQLHAQTKDQSCSSDPKTIYRGVYTGKTQCERSLVTIKGAELLQVASHVCSSVSI